MRAQRAQRGVGFQGHVRFSEIAAFPRRHRRAAGRPETQPEQQRRQQSVGLFHQWGTDRRVLIVPGILGQQLFYVPPEFLSLPAPKAQVHVTNDPLAVYQVG
jgi:hypothetical protein